jgi:hypothetical protein
MSFALSDIKNSILRETYGFPYDPFPLSETYGYSAKQSVAYAL